MRRLKIVVYFLILGILSSLLGNVSFAWASTQDKLVITEIYDLDLASAPLMFPVGSHHFQETIQTYSNCPLYAVCEDENESTELIPSYDIHSVDVQKEGIYEMTMTLQYDKEMFQLSENYSETYTIPVCISDPEKFEIFPTFTSFHHTTLSFLHHFKDFSTIEGAYVKSKTALTQSQLNKAEWTTITSSENFNTTPDGVMLSSAFFEEDGYLYIKLTNENLTSNILCLEQKGELVRSKPIEGDRDGGDFSSEDSFEITSPVSTPDSGQTTNHTSAPKPTATAAIIIPTTSVSSIPKKETTRTKKKKNSSSSQKSEGMITGITSSTEKSGSNTNTTTSMKKDTADSATTSHASEKKTIEQVGSNRISLSGKRLRLIAESNPNYVPFTYDNITLEIPTNYLLSLNLKDNEVLMVSIVPGSGKEVTLAVRAAGKVLTNIPNSRLTWKQENKTRTIDKTGVYKPPGSAKQNLPVKRNRVPRLVIIGAIMLVLISTGCFVYHKKERKH